MGLSILLAAAAISSAQAAPAASPATKSPDKPAAKARTCSGNTFEATYDRNVDGKPRRSKLTLCGKAGQSQAEWLRTLTDAADQLRANPGMLPDTKGEVLTALDAEIAKVRGQIAAAQAATAPVPLARPAAPESSSLASQSGYSVLPPMPAPKRAAPLVASRPAAGAAASAGVAAAAPVLSRPRLTIRCSAPSDGGMARPCRSIEPSTMVVVEAGEQLPSGVSLRFVREGKVRAEVALAQLASGESVNFKTPRRLCSGVLNSSAEIQVVRRSVAASAGQVVESIGPFRLSC